jgi:VWFA-related protein
MKAGLLGMLAWLGCLLPAATPQPTPIFSAKIDAVRVDVLVTEGGRPVLGLGSEDFEVFDNGVPQRVDLVSFEAIPLNVVVVLDVSASVTGQRLEHLRAAGGALLDALKGDDQAALITFGHAVVIRSALTRDVEKIRAGLADTEARGMTSLLDATYTGIVLGESDIGRALVILFSDGVDTASWLGEDALLQTARRSDAVVYAVHLRPAGGSSFLRAVTTATGGGLFQIESSRDLSATFVSILEEFRHRYLVSYTPEGVPRDGWHTVDVRVKPRGSRRPTVKARPGYLAGQ